MKVKRDWIAMLTIFGIAFAVRICALFLVYSNQVFTQYLTLGEQLRHNRFLTIQPFSYSPVYCYFLAFSRTLCNSLFFVLVLQCIIGGITCVLIFLISRKLLGSRTAYACAAFACVYRSFILYDLSFISDFLGVALQLFFAASLRSGQKTRYWIVPGIAIGLCILQRPNSVLLIPCMLLWLYIHRDSLRDWLAKSTVAIVCLLLVLLPIILQNWKLTGNFSLAYSSPGYVLYCSNNYACTGTRYSPPPLLIQAELTEPASEEYIFRGDVEFSNELASGISGCDLDIKKASDYYRVQCFQYLRSYPRKAMVLFLRKSWMIFHGYEPHDTLPIVMKQRSLFLPIGYWLISSLGLLGLFLSRKNWKLWLPVYFILINQFIMMLLFYVVVRFRLPLEATLIIASALALKTIFLTMRNRQWQQAMLLATATGMLFFACNIKDTTIRQSATESQVNLHFMAAEVAYESQNYRKAISYMRFALEKADATQAAACHRYLAKIYKRLGENGQSERERQSAENSAAGELKALEIEVSYAKISLRRLLRLAFLYEQKRKMQAAYRIFSLANDIEPANPIVRYQLARLQLALGDKSGGQDNLKIALADGLLFTSYGMYACFYLAETYRQSDDETAKKYYIQSARQSRFLKWTGKKQHTQNILMRLRSLGYLK